jgi:hypothetical protein
MPSTILPNMAGMAGNADQYQTIGEALSQSPRWQPYCEGLDGWDRAATAILLENQFQFMENELNEVTKILQIGNFDKFAFPIIRAVYPNLIANEIVSVQPMAGPVSLIFYLDYLYGTAKGGISSGAAAFDARTGGTGNETFSGDAVNEESLTSEISSGDLSAVSTAYGPIRPGTVTVTYVSTANGTVTATDDGNGGFVGLGSSDTGSVSYAATATTGTITINTSGNDMTAATVTYRYDSEAVDNVPQIDLQLTSAPVMALVRKLRARWSLEAAQNLNALHGLDAEAELVGIMAEVIKQELDREIINDLDAFAGAGTVTWDKSVPAGISYTEHKLSFIDACISLNNRVYSATKRAQTNWIVAGISVCDVIESLPTFVAAPGALGTQSNTGVIKIGTLNNRWTVYKDPFLTTTSWIQGYKGNSFLDTGYVYSPYIPLYTTPTIILDDFIGRKGIGTQYGKKTVNSLFYGKGSLINP